MKARVVDSKKDLRRKLSSVGRSGVTLHEFGSMLLRRELLRLHGRATNVYPSIYLCISVCVKYDY